MMTQPEPVPAPRLRERQTAVAERLGTDVLVLPGAVTRYRSRDTEYPHRPDSELYWLTGLTDPDVVAVFRGGTAEAELTLFVRPRDPEAELWTGVRRDPEALREAAGAAAVHPIHEVGERFPELVDGVDSLYFRLGEHPRLEGLVVEALRRGRLRGARKGTGPRRVVDPGELLDELRLRKDPWEVAQIRQAARITMEGFRALQGALGPGTPEWGLQAALEGAFRRKGSSGPAYETIVGSGANACVLHYVSNDRIPEPAELVLVDAGAAWGLYAADITRTYPLAWRFTGDQRAVYEVVEEARREAVAAVAPGVSLARIHQVAVGTLVQGLLELKVLDGDAAALVEEEAHKPFYPHQTSHWLGLDVHDPGDYVVGGRPRTLEPGMVLTVEPGLYFGPAAMEAAGIRGERFRGIGVRIEDDILVTETGSENLTGELETDPDEVERTLDR